MKKQKWMKWEPIEGISQTLYHESLKFSDNHLVINFQGRGKNSPILIINFENFLTLRIVDEGNLLKDPYDVDEAVVKMKLESGSYYKWSLFTVENSLYLEWFYTRNNNIRKNTEIVHYIIITPDDVIEILSSVVPIVNWKS